MADYASFMSDVSKGQAPIYMRDRTGAMVQLGFARDIEWRREPGHDEITLKLYADRLPGARTHVSVDALWGVKPIPHNRYDLRLFADGMTAQLDRSTKILEPFLNERCTIMSPTPKTRKKPTPPTRRPEDPFTPGKPPKTARWRVRTFQQPDRAMAGVHQGLTASIRVIDERFMTAAEWKSFAAGLAAAGIVGPAAWADDQGLIGAPIRYEPAAGLTVSLFREAL